MLTLEREFAIKILCLLATHVLRMSQILLENLSHSPVERE
jgi:hypothetical protein